MCLDKSWISLDMWIGLIWISSTDSLTAAASFRCGGGWGGVSDTNTRPWKFDYPLGYQCRQSACLKRHFLDSNG